MADQQIVLPDWFAGPLVSLFAFYGKVPTAPDGVKYWKTLHDLTPRVWSAAVAIAMRTRGPFVPYPHDLREDAQEAQSAILKALGPYRPGECCNFTGWQEKAVDGVQRAVRCTCWATYQARLEEYGVGASKRLISAKVPKMILPAADRDAFDPRMAQLAAGDR